MQRMAALVYILSPHHASINLLEPENLKLMPVPQCSGFNRSKLECILKVYHHYIATSFEAKSNTQLHVQYMEVCTTENLALIGVQCKNQLTCVYNS